MNRLMITGAVMLLLTACTTENLKENSRGQKIDFRASTTKATEITISNFDSFICTAINENGEFHFSNEEFERLGSYYNSATDYYWPSDGSSLDFYAWSPSADKLGGTLTITPDEQKLTGFTCNPDISEQVDFISSTGSGNKQTSSAGMELSFTHNMSQIEVKTRSANTGYVYKIIGARIGNIQSSGDFDFSTGTWSNVNTKTTYTIEYDNARTIDELSVSLMKTNGDNAMLIPQDITPWDPENDPTNTEKGAYIAVKARITTTTGRIIYPLEGEYDWIAVPLGDGYVSSWESGLRYIYTLDWSTGGGYVYPEKPAYPDSYQGYDCFSAGDKIMSTPIVLGLSVSSWSNSYPDWVDM